jgi:uncharacterized phage protein gp47/JayE
MQLQLQTFTTLINNAAAAVQGAATQLIDLTVGSTFRAILEANASMALWLQWLILQVLRMTRASTSADADLDSWMADYALTRLAATFAGGNVTFSRFTSIGSALIPVGMSVRTADASQTFLVQANPSDPNWSAGQKGYLAASGNASIVVPVAAAVAGVSGNVQAGTISLIAASLPGIDTVTNAVSLVGGIDAETDNAFRNRFIDYIASLSRATTIAVKAAISGVELGLNFTVTENVTPDGLSRPGSFLAVVDDGTGTPLPALLTRVAAAIEAVRPVGTSYGVIPPVLVNATIVAALVTDGSVPHATAAAAVRNAISAYVSGLPIGAPLAFARITQLAFAASAAVTNVTGITLNGGAGDINPTATGVVRPASITVY